MRPSGYSAPIRRFIERLATQCSLGHSASSRLLPEPPSRRCGARVVPEPHEPKNFARSRRDILIGARVGTLPCVGDRRRSHAKIPPVQVFGAEARTNGAGPFSRIRSWSKNRRDIISEPEPECFPGAEAKAVKTINAPHPRLRPCSVILAG